MVCYSGRMELSEQVYRYYLDNKHLLSEDKIFHFATRMHAWKGDPETALLLDSSREYIAPSGTSLASLMQSIVNTPQTGRRNAHELRQPFFDKYPLLYGAHLALFRVRHLEAVYGIDAREALFAAIPEADLTDLRDVLLRDDDALRTLSTFAVNYCYLLERVIRRDDTSLDVRRFYDVAQGYDTSNILHIQLLIYLYTHCIIGESNFYTRTIPAGNLPLYTTMLSELETVIADNFERINLDNKLEFLVCARICGVTTNLSERIYAEAQQSISPEGTFIIDVHNDNAQADRNDFVRSEHRNVLFIMSTTPYVPHSTLVG